ncbi:ATP-binding protein [Massilia sp.]|uniref:ATP-binding protein n=1 Tax=Massilia sp. TaxID=1882437 RepID=UPI00391AAC1D
MLEVSERVKAEDALRQAHKMEAVGQLASGVAHDFNNVLQIISSNLQLMELDGIGSVLGARVASAVAAVERGSKLSSQLLAFARRRPLQPVATDLERLLADMESLLLRALGDRIVLDLRRTPGLWNAGVDRNQLENAILNMAINARDAMDGSGRLTIGVDNGDASAGHVRLSIADTGCGMTPEVLEKIFEPFYTTKAPGEGTGLGMSMVYDFVKQSAARSVSTADPEQERRSRSCSRAPTARPCTCRPRAKPACRAATKPSWWSTTTKRWWRPPKTVLHLVQNATQAMDKDGRLEVAVDAAHWPGDPGTGEAPAYLRVRIADNGAGMGDEALRRVRALLLDQDGPAPCRPGIEPGLRLRETERRADRPGERGRQ